MMLTLYQMDLSLETLQVGQILMVNHTST